MTAMGKSRTSKHSHPWMATLYDPMLEIAEQRFLGRLRAASAGKAVGCVLEVGAGTGLNFRHYRAPAVREVLAIEPDPYMRRRAEPRAAQAAVRIRLMVGIAEALPLPDGSVDTIVATLVLCSVERPEQAVREWRRVLRAGGVVHWVEHIRSPEPWRARLQDWVAPLWRRVAAGCHPNRDALGILRSAGFEVQERERVEAGFPWTKPIVAGSARLP
jgi:ubiquinone/menaquinone biosynthesis C-methylase UbiE